MPIYTTTPDVSGITPDSYGELVVQPAIAASTFAQVANVVTTKSTHFHVPIVTDDPSAAWTNEGDEIATSDPVLEELTISPPAVKGLTIISSELADDSNPAAAQVVGDGLGRDIARRIDEAMFTGLPSPAPAGLTTLSGVQSHVNATAFDNLDWAASAVSLAETVGATVTAFVTNPATALQLATIKSQTGSNQPVLGMDATSATSRMVLGVPMYVSQYVAPDTLWAIDASRTWLVVRADASIVADRSAYFSSDRVGVRGIMRAAPAFTHPQSVVKVTLA